MARPPLRGIKRIRSLLRRLPDEVSGEIVVELNVTGRRILSAVLARAPRRTGHLQAGLQMRVQPKSLRLLIGLIGTPKQRAAIFYARIQDLGRRASIVTVRRLSKAGRQEHLARIRAGTGRASNKPADLVSQYTLHVPAKEGKRFVTGRYPDLRAELRSNIKGIFTRSLAGISGGGDE